MLFFFLILIFMILTLFSPKDLSLNISIYSYFISNMKHRYIFNMLKLTFQMTLTENKKKNVKDALTNFFMLIRNKIQCNNYCITFKSEIFWLKKYIANKCTITVVRIYLYIILMLNELFFYSSIIISLYMIN